MILQALDGYYHRLARREGDTLPLYGYSEQAVSYALILKEDGTLVDVLPLGSQGQRRFEPKRIPVPGPILRTSGIASNFLWDKTAYVLGVKRDAADKTKIIEALREHAAFRKLHEELLAETDDEGLLAVLAFLANWTPAAFETLSNRYEILDANLVFRLDGELGFIHDQPAVRDIWARKLAGNKGADGLCLVSGKIAPLARLHPSIKGVRDAQSSGAAIVSFNLDAFTSFGKDQGMNAPVSEQATFAYTTSLNHLLRADERNRQRLQIADATTVFWAEARTSEEEPAAEAAEELFPCMAAPPSQEKLDTTEGAKVRAVLDKVAAGRPLKEINPSLDEGTRLFVLGLAPNAARLSVRFWHVDMLGTLAKRFRQHWLDLYLEPCPWKLRPPSVKRLLYQTAAQQKEENIPRNLAGEVMRAILSGNRYPRTLLTRAIGRCRSDRNVTMTEAGLRAALIKACISRDLRADRKENSVPCSNDETCSHQGYQLGRLLAILENTQEAAMGDINSTIVDKYYSSAAATPQRVFGMLLGLSKHHQAALRRGRAASWVKDPKHYAYTQAVRINDVLELLENGLPKMLSVEDQGWFAIGYYHERYSKRSKPRTDDSSDDQPALDDEA